MAEKSLPDIAVLRQVLKCYPNSGRLFWLHRPREFFTSDRIYKAWNSRYAGTEAFTTINAAGYRVAALFDEKFYGHRVIFALCHGHWPTGEIDHIDGDRSNNRLINLRDVTSRDNSKNSGFRSDNTSGVMGIYQHKTSGRWRAVIGVNRRTVHLGYFDTLDQASAARYKAEKLYGFHNNHGRQA